MLGVPPLGVYNQNTVGENISQTVGPMR